MEDTTPVDRLITNQLQANVVSEKSTSTNRHKKSILVNDINANDVKKLKKMISSAEFKNSIVHWNCQDYVLEILNKLAEKCIVDEDEKEYKNARNELKNNYGAMIWCNNSGPSNLWDAFQQRLYCHSFVPSRRQAR